MLVLTRKSQEKIHVGENVTITVVRIKGNTVRIGIEAPKNVRVMRGEIHGEPASESLEFASGEIEIELPASEMARGEETQPIAFPPTRSRKPTSGTAAPLGQRKTLKFAAAVPTSAV